MLNEDMNIVMKRLHELAEKCHGPIIVLHHANRTEEKTPLGATCILSRSDVLIRVEGRTVGAAWKAEKVKGGQKTDWHPFYFQRVGLGTNADGQEMTSCVLVEGTAPKTPKAKPSKSTPQKADPTSAVQPSAPEKAQVSESSGSVAPETPPTPAQTFQGWRSLPTA